MDAGLAFRHGEEGPYPRRFDFPDIYRPADEWRALLGGAPADVVHLPSGELVPDLAPYTHVFVTGSEASINLPESWFGVEAEAVRRAFELGKPMLGSCFASSSALLTAQSSLRDPDNRHWLLVVVR